MAEPASTTAIRVFLSYSSDQATIAEQVCLTMRTSGHTVFFDRTTLTPGEAYDQEILDAIRSSDLFVFLISPGSIREGSYTRTELRFAQNTWPNPAGRILPVLAVPTEFSEIPNYLKAVTVLRPVGNLVAEVSAAVNDFAAGRTPQDTIAGKVELIDKIAEQTETLRKSNAVTKIDRQWQVQAEKLSPSIGGSRLTPIHMQALAVLFLLIGVVGMGFGVSSPHNGGAFAAFALFIGVMGASRFFWLARSFKAAEREYRQKRRKAMSGKRDHLPTFPKEASTSQAPDEFSRDLERH